jgi:murein DD-endopeptidase MepM/ murein hydrolase activator NlpD
MGKGQNNNSYPSYGTDSHDDNNWRRMLIAAGSATAVLGSLTLLVVAAHDKNPEKVESIPVVGNLFEDEDMEADAATTPPEDASAPLTLPPYTSVTSIDHQTTYTMRDAVPRDEVFRMDINGITYAWPVGRPDYDLYRIALPCDLDATTPEAVQQGKMPCHHDPIKDAPDYIAPFDNYATDFVYRDVAYDTETLGQNDGGTVDAIVGEPVRAITDGTIISVDPGSQDPSCSQIKLQSIDGHVWWFGHLAANPLVKAGDPVTAGQEIAAVGGPECAGGTVPHVHSQSMPQGVTEASTENRDTHSVEIQSKLFLGLYEKNMAQG